MNISQRFIRTTCLLSCLLWLAACTGLPKSEPLKIFQLPETRIAQDAYQTVLPFSLRINTPYSGFALSSPRIIVNAEGEQLSSYKGVRWSDPPAVLLREHLAIAFSRHGGLANISTDEHALYADMHLGSDLRSFQLVYTDSPRVVIKLDARLINPTSRHIHASHTFVIEQPLPDAQIPNVIMAFGAAADKLAEQMIQWIHAQLQSGVVPSPDISAEQ